MYIKSISLVNYRGFRDNVYIDFWNGSDQSPRMNIFVGENGGGKSTILDAIAKSISWFPARVQSSSRQGQFIENDEINNFENYARINLEVGRIYAKLEIDSFPDDLFSFIDEDDYNSKSFEFKSKTPVSWSIARTKKGSPIKTRSDFSQLNKITKEIQDNLQFLNAEVTLPSIMYYGTNRHISKSNGRFRNRWSFNGSNALEEYSKPLSGDNGFQNFFEWFEELENYENQRFRDLYRDSNNSGLKAIESLDNFEEDPRLHFTRKAVFEFLDNFTEMHIDRGSSNRIKVMKNAKWLNIDQLSQGEKSLLVLVGDIARTLSVMNPNSQKPLDSPGIVLIDEVDVHLHPSWQVSLPQKLSSIFPNCQFFITTHSPLVLSNAQNCNIFAVAENEISKVDGTYGENASYILETVLGANSMDSSVLEQSDRIQSLLDSDDLIKAREKFSILEREINTKGQLYNTLRNKILLTEFRLKDRTTDG